MSPLPWSQLGPPTAIFNSTSPTLSIVLKYQQHCPPPPGGGLVSKLFWYKSSNAEYKF